MKISKYKVDKTILFCMFSFFIISIITIYSAQSLLPNYMHNLAFKQLIWYFIGFIITFFIISIGNKLIYNYVWIMYIACILLLFVLLFLGTPINDARCWFTLPFGLGTFQPSEFMKIVLILFLGTMINKFHTDYPKPSVKEEFIFLLKVGIVVLIPSLLTFLEPDTGVVLIYLLITITMLFVSGIRYRWFIILISIFLGLVGIILLIYFLNNDLFINLFGTSFFLRVDRLINWSNKSGYQLEHGISAIGSAGLFGHGFNNTPIYFPEPQTDFIFAVFASNFGFIGSIFLLSLIVIFDTKLIIMAKKTNNKIDQLVISGIVGMLIYQQIQNIGMTVGLLPITGITLPFISYGGSSLISYIIMAAIIFNISNYSIRYSN